jgi:uroporphyrinogen III methyltransferase / synthase
MAKLNREEEPSRDSFHPLAGKRIVVTRARAQASGLAQRLEALGAEVIAFPTIEIQPPASYGALDEAIESIRNYAWLIFTSVNGVEQFFSRAKLLRKSPTDFKGIAVAAIGPETANRLEAEGVRCRLVPKQYQAEGILDLLTPEQMRGRHVLIPRAAKARDVLPQTLRAWGAEVRVIEAYRTVIPRADASALVRSLRAREVDMVTFTSSSTVANFVELFSGQSLEESLAGAAVACIGPITEKTVEELGGRADVVATDFTIPGLVQAIVRYFATKAGPHQATSKNTQL